MDTNASPPPAGAVVPQPHEPEHHPHVEQLVLAPAQRHVQVPDQPPVIRRVPTFPEPQDGGVVVDAPQCSGAELNVKGHI